MNVDTKFNNVNKLLFETTISNNIDTIVRNIDNLQSNIKDYSQEVQEQIIDYAFNKYCEMDFLDFIRYEFKGKELNYILKKYNLIDSNVYKEVLLLEKKMKLLNLI